jgi:hypothetical protein
MLGANITSMISNSNDQLAFNLLKQFAHDIHSGEVTLASSDVLEKQLQKPFSSLRGLFKGQSSVVARDQDRI